MFKKYCIYIPLSILLIGGFTESPASGAEAIELLLSQVGQESDISTGETIEDTLVQVSITSEPDSASILYNSKAADGATPEIFMLTEGKYNFEVIKDKYLPLSYELEVLLSKPITAHFILSKMEPEEITAGDLGLEYLEEKKTKDLQAAVRFQQSFNRAAEVFAIIPFGQGLLAKLIMGDDYSDQTTVLIISGAGLSLTSWLTGKLLASAKRRKMERENMTIEEENSIIRQHNKEIDEKLRELNDERHSVWEKENESRGKVVIKQVN